MLIPSVGQDRLILPVRDQAIPNYSHWGTRAIAGDRPPRYGKKKRAVYRRARACPSPCLGREGNGFVGVRFSRGSNDRGGQAPALR